MYNIRCTNTKLSFSLNKREGVSLKKGFLIKIKAYIGILLILLSVASIIYWEQYGREYLLYKDILVVKEDVPPKLIITESNIDEYFSYAKREETMLVKGYITNKKDIIGLQSIQFIAKNSQVCLRYFEDSRIVLDDNQYIFKIPRDWLLAFPSSLRRKDSAYLYAIDNIDGDTKQLSYQRKNVGDQITRVTVAYVKDSANREVLSIDKTNRLDGTSKIVDIEVIVTLEQINKIKELCLNGKSIIMLYN